MLKRISVIIPVYNVEKYLSECIESVLKQTYKNIEIILINDASTDKSGEICQQYADNHSNIIFIDCKENKGVVHARGLGLERATGEYIGFVDSDDWIEAEMYEKLYKAIDNVDMSMCGINRICRGKCSKVIFDYHDGIYSGNKYKEFVANSLYDYKSQMLHTMWPNIWSKLFRKDILDKIYGDIDCDMDYAEDMVLLYKYMLRIDSVRVIDNALYNYRKRENSLSNDINDNRLKNIYKVYFSLKDDFKEYENEKELTVRLQKWVECKVCQAINENMGFCEEIHIPIYLIDNISAVETKKIVLYGAGEAGRDYYWQLTKRGCNIVAWVDRDYEFYKHISFGISNPDIVRDIEFDIVIITVRDEFIAQQIKSKLLSMGINEEKIVWEKLIKIY